VEARPQDVPSLGRGEFLASGLLGELSGQPRLALPAWGVQQQDR
jgi:hypothetical protein